MLHNFPCNAEKLLELIVDDFGRHIWLDLNRSTKVHATFIELINRIYNNEGLEMSICALSDQHSWKKVARIVIFGKKNSIPKDDWTLALGAQISKK